MENKMEAKMNAEIFSIGIAITAIWAIQPWIMKHGVLSKPRLSIGIVILFNVLLTMYLGNMLHVAIQDMEVRTLYLLLVWYPIATQILRYMHAFAVGGDVFQRHFQLTTLRRTILFTLSVPTLVFHSEKEENVAKTKNTAAASLRDDLRSCLTDLAQMFLICGIVVKFRLDVTLPQPVRRLIRIYIMGLSVASLKLFLELPIKLALLRATDIARIIPLYDQPQLAASPRNLWHRWSVSIGYHLKHGFYRGAQQGHAARWVATAVPFIVNGVLHATWWAYVIIGTMDDRYIYLLFLFPMTAIGVEDIVVKKAGAWFTSSQRDGMAKAKTNATQELALWQRTVNLIVLWVGLYCIVGMMSSVHGVPTELGEVCRKDLRFLKLDLD